MKNILPKTAAVVLSLFAVLTIFMSGSVIFDLFGIRAKEGNYVLFVVILNFICGFLYLIAAFGLFTKKIWTTQLLIASLGVLLVSFLGLLWHIESGGIYEMGTVRAMLFRISVTILFAGISWYYISKDNKSSKTPAR
ncbi:MAG: hypothetical protein Q7T20_03515 [Saprospiraceae bacterium]|nr:hypothetical protein [Saprospiraceae bacterium]